MDSSISPKDEIWFLRVCHHISTDLYGRAFVPGACITCTEMDLEGYPLQLSCIATKVSLVLWGWNED